jgi:3-(3-hydroxy-phenyl)propionate hydroxylase
MTPDSERVLIAGAGPVGMVCALALNRQGIKVTVLEAEPAPVEDQRAASLHPPTIEMLAGLGIAEKIIPLGLVSPKYQFRDRVTGELVAEFDLGLLEDELPYPYVLQYEQYKLTGDIARQYGNESDFDVRFSTRVTAVRLDADGVLVEAEGPNGTERHPAAYVIGADGGRSAVRRAAGIAFEGFTYPERFIKIATPYDFQLAHADYAYRNYFSDPQEWCNLFKVTGKRPPGLWRAVFPTRTDETEQEAVDPAAIEARMQKFFPKPGRYDIEYCNVYSVSQRVAATFRKGRALLVGDAAHVNNPIGGMGMNGGVHDAINLCEKLPRVLRGEAPETLLDLYSRQRRRVAIDYTQAQTISNKKTLEEREPEVRRRNLDELRRTAADPERARAYMRRAALIESLRAASSVT